ncbi:DUF4868 domain-containing protein [Candidatus Saccharibacteria bacterium]|nr:DUF4868 domain-containing protein [Candidatus Saccharibacteria bacterium]
MNEVNESNEAKAEPKANTGKTPTFDWWGWANNLEQFSKTATPEVFFFNKNYTPFKVRFTDKLTSSLRALFLQEALGFMSTAVEKGYTVQDLHEAYSEEQVLWTTDTERVERLTTVLHLIETEYKDLVYFNEQDFDFRRMKGIMVRFTAGDDSFYVIKSLAASSALREKTGWELRGETLEPFSADVGLSVPSGNEMIVSNGKILIFNRPKFERLFQYDVKTELLASQQARDLMAKYKLSLAEGLKLEDLLKDSKALVTKIDKLDAETPIPQEKIIDYADEMQLELMADEQGKIIIMEQKDLATFVNLLNEDYYTSPVSGVRYEVKSKKALK